MSQEHWSQFWSQGFITTFGDSFPENYTGELRRFWENLFISIEPNCSILDIATGNGAIATIAAEEARHACKNVSIFAADAAMIADGIKLPLDIRGLRNTIQFLSNTSCESLPFSEDFFNLVTSQYGIEYSDWQLSLAEVFRILKPGGEAHFICHHKNSSIMKASMSEMPIYEAALNEYRIFDLAIEFTQNYRMKRGRQDKQSSEVINEKINAFRLQYRRSQLCNLFISEVADAAQKLGTRGPEQTIVHLNNRKAEFEAAYLRLSDMSTSALDDEKIERLSEVSRETGFSHVSTSNFNGGSGMIGTHFYLLK